MWLESGVYVPLMTFHTALLVPMEFSEADPVVPLELNEQVARMGREDFRVEA